MTLGDDVVNCLPLVVDGTTLGSFNCYYDGATNGVLSTSTKSYKPAFVTGRLRLSQRDRDDQRLQPGEKLAGKQATERVVSS